MTNKIHENIQTIGVLTPIPNEAWIGLSGVILGSILSIFGVWMTNKSNLALMKKQLEDKRLSEQKELKRTRLEELYVLTGNWLNVLAGSYLSLNYVMQGKMSYETHLEQVIEKGKNLKYDFNRFEMIIDIYAEEIKPFYGEILQARNELNEISQQFIQAYKDDDANRGDFLEPYVAAQREIEQCGLLFQSEISKIAKNL